MEDSLKADPKNVVSKQKCFNYMVIFSISSIHFCVVFKQKCIHFIEKWPFMVIFQNNLYIFCLDITQLFSKHHSSSGS